MLKVTAVKPKNTKMFAAMRGIAGTRYFFLMAFEMARRMSTQNEKKMAMAPCRVSVKAFFGYIIKPQKHKTRHPTIAVY
jgi:hypothetical protein